MTTIRDRYPKSARFPMDTRPARWNVKQACEVTFDWDFGDGRKALNTLYQKGKVGQWDAQARIDWDVELRHENPLECPDDTHILYGSPMWERASEGERVEMRRHYQAWTISQFLVGEEAAMSCAAKIVQQAPDLDAKLFAATQVMDEARHVEVFKRLAGKIDLAYPITSPLQTLVGQALGDGRWDYTYLAMQVVIEGLALASFGSLRDSTGSPLARQVVAYVMQDEARHVAFGHLALRDYYRELSDAERAERGVFLAEACRLMRDRFTSPEVMVVLGLPLAECGAWATKSPRAVAHRTALFRRIVPIIKGIGLWSEKLAADFKAMGLLSEEDVDVWAIHDSDERFAVELDRAR